MPVVVALELDGQDESDLAVQGSEVEPVEVLRDRDPQGVDVLSRPLGADQLGLEERVERLGQGDRRPYRSRVPWLAELDAACLTR